MEYIIYDGRNQSVILQRLHDYLSSPNHSLELAQIIFDKYITFTKKGHNDPLCQSRNALENDETFRIHKRLMLSVPPILMMIGIVGNVMSFLVLRHKTMIRHSTNFFLATLSIADLIVLIVGLFPKWIGEIVGDEIQHSSNFLCKLINILGYSSSQFSAWLVLAVTIERYIVVCHVLRASRLCSRERARKFVICLAVACLSINAHFCWTIGLRDDDCFDTTKCSGLPEYEKLVQSVWPWVDAIFYSMIPIIVISLLNILIIRQVMVATYSRQSMQHGRLLNAKLSKRVKTKNSKLTIMLLTISFTFCATTLPMNIIMIAGLSVSEPRDWLIRTTSELLMYLNHSINFFLYCATGQKFRLMAVRTVCGPCLSRKRKLSSCDHSKHLYCSRGVASGMCAHKITRESSFRRNDTAV